MMVCFLTLSTPRSYAQEVSTRWEQPAILFDAGEMARVFNPQAIEDTEGRIKILWEIAAKGAAAPVDLPNGIYCIDGDGSTWSVPVDVIVAADGGRTFWIQHAVDVYGRLHLVWTGPNAEIYYSRAPSARACDPHSWETMTVPISNQALHSDIVVDDQDVVHVVYAARAKDVYYLRSSNAGLSWSDPVAVSSIEPTVATSFPSLAIDQERRIHVAWEQNQLPDGVPSLGLYYASSQDEGLTWSSPIQFSQDQGEYTQPTIAALADGTVHLLWNGRVSTKGRYHQWSTDGGVTWSTINEFVPRSMGGGQTGPPGFDTDSAGRLHVVTGTDETTYAAWTGQRWLPAYDIAPFETFGNMEDQHMTVIQGHVLYALANASLRQIILVRGVTDAPEIAPDFRSLPTPPILATPTMKASPTASSPGSVQTTATLPLELTGTTPAARSLAPVLLSSSLAFLVVAAVMIAVIMRRR